MNIFTDGKVCAKCDQWKPLDGFYRQPIGRLGRESRCKVCLSIITKIRSSTPEAKAKQRAYDLKRNARPDVAARNNVLRKAPERRAKIKAWRKMKLKTDFRYATIERARGMVHRTLAASGMDKKLPTFDLLGYGPEKLMARIECQFKPGMSWANHSEWHIDHKKPLTAFLDQGEVRPYIINALSNLQPLWGSENMSKNNKWPYSVPANDNKSLQRGAA